INRIRGAQILLTPRVMTLLAAQSQDPDPRVQSALVDGLSATLYYRRPADSSPTIDALADLLAHTDNNTSLEITDMFGNLFQPADVEATEKVRDQLLRLVASETGSIELRRSAARALVQALASNPKLATEQAIASLRSLIA